MALDCLSCCKCLLVYVNFDLTHWSVDVPRIAPKVLTEHLDFKTFPGGGGGMPQDPSSLCHVIYGLTSFYLGATALFWAELHEQITQNTIILFITILLRYNVALHASIYIHINQIASQGKFYI